MPALRQNPGSAPRSEVPYLDPAVSFSSAVEYWMPFPWGTVDSGITNTCAFDSFLAHLVWMHRRDPTYFVRNLNLVNSRAEQAVKAVVNLYWRQLPVPSAENLSTRAHFIWRDMLLQDRSQQRPLYGLQRDPATGKTFVNMAGGHLTSVLTPLSDSSLMWFVHSCDCRESADPSSRFSQVVAADIWKVTTGVYDTPKSKLKCRACQEPFDSHHRPLVAPSTWFVHFPVWDGQNARPPFELSDLPTILYLTELRTGNEITFQLGYVGYATSGTPRNPLTHVTSIHYIGRDYYWYDGMVDSGTLHQMEDAYQEAPAHMGDPQYVVYFRL